MLVSGGVKSTTAIMPVQGVKNTTVIVGACFISSVIWRFGASLRPMGEIGFALVWNFMPELRFSCTLMAGRMIYKSEMCCCFLVASHSLPAHVFLDNELVSLFKFV